MAKGTSLLNTELKAQRVKEALLYMAERMDEGEKIFKSGRCKASAESYRHAIQLLETWFTDELAQEETAA